MKKLLLLFVALFTMASMPAYAALFSTSPKLLQQSSTDVKIYFDPNDESVPAALKTATEVYAHIGVTLTSAPSTWVHVIGDWADKDPKKKFVKNSNGLWELNIGTINSYFGITDSSEEVAKIAIIALNAAGTAQTGDNFIDVLPAGFQVSLEYDAPSLVLSAAKTINFTVNASQAATLTLSVDGTQIATASNVKELTKGYAFNTKGKFYTVTATASNGSETVSKEVTVAYPEPSTQANYPGGVPKQGAVKNADGTVTFCVAAPNKSSVILIPSWDNYQTLNKNVMKYQDYQGFRYFWITTAEKLADNVDYPYYYLVDGTVKVADPYAKMMLDPYSDKWLPTSCFPDKPAYPYELFDDTMLAVYRGDIDDYNWDDATKNFVIPDKKALTIYELLIRDWTGDGDDQDGKSFGTFKTALPKISHLVSLGVNAVEIMPVMEFNGNSSWGYNTNGYMALDKAYGSPKDMRDFIAECHRNGIAVILDIVFNQADGLHPWYQMYDIKSNPFFNAEAPHDYSVLNDWNQDCALVMNHWKDVLTYWLEAYKVDGFRFDLVKGLGSNSSYGSGTDRYNQSRIDNMITLHNAIKAVNPNALHINELLGDASEDKAMGADGQMNWSKVCNGSYQYAMGFADGNGDTKGFYAPNWSRNLGETVDYAESHDEPRVASKVRVYGHSSVKYTSSATKDNIKSATVKRLGAVAAQMLMCPGAKMLWQFGELGADEEQGSELEKLRAIAPQWNLMNNTHRNALFENYQALCYLRRNNPDLFANGTCVLTGFNNTLTAGRTIRVTNGNKEVIDFFNPAVSGAALTVTATATKLNQNNCQLVTASEGTTATLTGTGSSVSVSLPAHSFAVFATKDVSEIDEISADLNGSNVVVYTEPGRIVIEGDYNSAEVYNMQGMRFSSLEVPAGLYIVRVDGTSFKVAVN